MSTSSSTWTRCAGASRIRALRVDAWRVVEAQHQVSTRKLVDSDAEQQLLEELIESVKPAQRVSSHLHYLLFTPFRYPPLRHGSRFGKRTEPGIWYGAQEMRTAFAEVAYYRLLFMEGTRAELASVQTELTAFRIRIETPAGVDLMKAVQSPTHYEASQACGAEMRAAGVVAFRYASARDVEHGANIGVFSPAAFGRRSPRSVETWHCIATRDIVELTKRDYFARASFTFPSEQFLVEGALPRPAI